MSFLKSALGRLRGDRVARQRGEEDAPLDTQTSTARDGGGVDDAGAQDRNSTTGTTPNETPVGRVSGDETGDTQASGADRRSGRDPDAHDGALRDE